MKEHKNSTKKNFLKKIFIKICRIFGYEIIDQNNFYIPTQGKNLDQDLNIQGKKSINLPLGEVKISRKVKSLTVIFRSCTSVNMLKGFSISAAYPNPFNPTTQMSITLNTAADVSVKVFNIMGQLVDVIAEGNYSPNTYNWTWDAENLASGVYLVRTQVGNNVDNQKVMLLK